ncbi:translation initiation factor IF-2-like [Vulpes lagopus]|uniref:translation initiation factor IF-2-like n=1 Tax=Vulpes lagopus TaxID=494514 RepID=UPI001BC9AC90|nr:translation initiation factor IF-2-like [Vulpes lagopus]
MPTTASLPNSDERKQGRSPPRAVLPAGGGGPTSSHFIRSTLGRRIRSGDGAAFPKVAARVPGGAGDPTELGGVPAHTRRFLPGTSGRRPAGGCGREPAAGDPLPRRGRPAAPGTRLAEVNADRQAGSPHAGSGPSFLPRRPRPRRPRPFGRTSALGRLTALRTLRGPCPGPEARSPKPGPATRRLGLPCPLPRGSSLLLQTGVCCLSSRPSVLFLRLSAFPGAVGPAWNALPTPLSALTRLGPVAIWSASPPPAPRRAERNNAVLYAVRLSRLLFEPTPFCVPGA